MIGLLGQKMPAQDSQFTGNGNCRDLMAASGADAQKERAQHRRIGRSPGGLDQHRSGMGPSVFADRPCWAKPSPDCRMRGLSPT